jgi:hypothetical protein
MRGTSVQSKPPDERELAAREATARELAVLGGDSAAALTAVAFVLLDHALHVSVVGLLAVLAAGVAILTFRVSRARLRTQRGVTRGEPTRRTPPRHLAHWLAMTPLYAGLAALLVTHQAGMSGLGGFGVAVLCVIAVTLVAAAVERFL